MNTADRIAAIREHLTVLTNTDNDAARLVGEVLADFPSIITAVSGPLGEQIEDLENELRDTNRIADVLRERINSALTYLSTDTEQDDED